MGDCHATCQFIVWQINVTRLLNTNNVCQWCKSYTWIYLVGKGNFSFSKCLSWLLRDATDLIVHLSDENSLQELTIRTHLRDVVLRCSRLVWLVTDVVELVNDTLPATSQQSNCFIVHLHPLAVLVEAFAGEFLQFYTGRTRIRLAFGGRPSRT